MNESMSIIRSEQSISRRFTAAKNNTSAIINLTLPFSILIPEAPYGRVKKK